MNKIKNRKGQNPSKNIKKDLNSEPYTTTKACQQHVQTKEFESSKGLRQKPIAIYSILVLSTRQTLRHSLHKPQSKP